MSYPQNTIRFSRFAANVRLLSLVRAGLILTCLLVANGPGQAHAQLFGSRTLGEGVNSPATQTQTSRGASGGPLGERGGRSAFQRPRPSVNDFVGRDQIERETFIGRARGNVSVSGVDTSGGLRRSRAQDILKRRQPNANVLQIQRGTGAQGPIYSPRLEVDFQHRPSAAAKSDRLAEQTIASIFATQGFPGVTISIEAGVATLRGKVASQTQKKIAAALVNLEPGIRSLDNQLQHQGERLRGAEALEAPE